VLLPSTAAQLQQSLEPQRPAVTGVNIKTHFIGATKQSRGSEAVCMWHSQAPLLDLSKILSSKHTSVGQVRPLVTCYYMC
jgi:hypothetical protein